MQINYSINKELSKVLNTIYKSENRYSTINENFVCMIAQEPHYRLRIEGPSHDFHQVTDRINSLRFLHKSNSEIGERCFFGNDRVCITFIDEHFIDIFKDALLYDLKVKETPLKYCDKKSSL